MRTLPLLIVLAACGSTEAPPPEPEPKPEVEEPKGPDLGIEASKLAAFAPLPADMPSADNPITPEKVELGRMLYYEPRVSKNHDISCNTCHLLDQYGVDSMATSTGHKEQKGGRNAPTVYNASAQIAQFWDGREPTVEAQAKGPPLNPIEMAMADAATVEGVLKSIPGYAEPFKAAFPDDAEPITYDNFGKAIGAFERTLVTPSKWDAFLAGDPAALTADEKKGFEEFYAAGCIACHSGAYLGGAMFQKVGLVKPWPNQEDKGKFEVTGKDADAMMFKVPVLRNIEKTGPYFHDGSVADLGEAVTMMASHQSGKELTPEQTASIVLFLNTLTGELPADKIAKPELPESGPDTPAPDPS